MNLVPVKGALDVLLICALQDEYKQVLTVSDGIVADGWVESINDEGWTVADASFESITGSSITIRATWASYMGRESAQATASMFIHKQPARCIAMSGICAGRRGKLSLGDVIFAERMWSYDSGKLVVEGEIEHFQGDQMQYRPKPVWVQRMQQVAASSSHGDWLSSRPSLPLEYQEDWVLRRLYENEDPTNLPDFKNECPNWDEVLKRLWKRGWVNESYITLTPDGEEKARKSNLLYPDKVPAPLDFQVHVASIATGAQVTEDEGIFPKLAGSMRKVLGIEMEASALAALGDLHDIPVVVAKGVSDFGDAFKDDRYRDFAAKASAELLIQFLRSSVDLYQVTSGGDNRKDVGSFSMTSVPLELIEALAEEYPALSDARSLWERAGGKASEVENISRPKDLWQKLWKRSTQGAQVTPQILLQTALEDTPNSPVLLRHMKMLAQH